jgi:hypothetical protein
MRERDTKSGIRTIKEIAALLFLLFICSVIFNSCYYDDANSIYPQSPLPGSSQCDTNNVSYTTVISPILLQNCALPGCHASSSPTGGYTLDNYNGVRSIVLSGRIIGAISHLAGYSPMPKDAAMLDACQIGQITSWINQGAKNN